MGSDRRATVEQKSVDRSSPEERLVRGALIICALGVLLCVVLGLNAYRLSRATFLSNVAENHRQLALGLAEHLASHQPEEGGPFDPEDVAIIVREHWEEVRGAFPGSQLCIIGPDGRLLSCDIHETEAHIEPGDWMLEPMHGDSMLRLRDVLAQGRTVAGTLDDDQGSPLISAYVPSDVGPLLIGLHINVAMITGALRDAANPWWFAFGIVTFILLPLGAYVLHLMNRGARLRLERTRDALSESEQLFRQIAESSHAGVWRMGRDGYTIYANQRLREILEVETLDELKTRTFREFFSAEMVSRIERELAKRRHGVASTYEVEVTGLRGTKRSILISGAPMSGPDGPDSTFVATVIDITDLRETEAALREAADQLRLSIAVARIALFDWNVRTGKAEWIGEMIELCGLPAREVAGVPEQFIDRVHPDDRDAVQRRWNRAINSGDPYNDEYRIVLDSGEVHWVAVEGRLFHDATGKPSRMLGVVRDVSGTRNQLSELTTTRQLLEQTFASLREAVLVVDRDSMQIVSCNQAAETVLGYPPEDLKGGTLAQLYPDEETWSARLKDQSSSLTESGFYVRDDRIRRANGVTFVAEITITLLEQQESKRAYMVVVVRDITVRREAEQRLRESERRYRQVFDQLPDGIVISRDGRILFANQALARLIGVRSRDELIGRNVLDFVPTDRQQDHIERGNRALSGNPMPLAECALLRPDGSVVPVETISTRTMYERAPAVQTMVRAITERLRTERGLRESETRLRVLVDQLPAILWTTDRNLRYTSSVGQGLRLLKLEPNEIVGQSVDQYLRNSDAKDDRLSLSAHRRALEGQSSTYEVYRMGHWFECYTEPLHDRSGQIAGVVGLAIDISERKKADRRQRLMMDELDHRVKNTLASVVSIAEQTISSSDSLNEFRQSFLGRVIAMARTHEALASGKWEGVDLRGVVDRIMRPHGQVDSSRVVIHGESIRLPASSALPITLTLHELATNAAKYGALSSESGQVTIAWETLKTETGESSVRITWHETGGPIVTPPTDTGMGTQLIEGLIEYELRGTVHLEYAPEGFQCELNIPLLGILDSAASETESPAPPPG